MEALSYSSITLSSRRCATTALSHANHDLLNIHLLLCNTVEKLGKTVSINNW